METILRASIGLLCWLVIAAAVAPARADEGDGIFADISTTLGSFTASLNYQQSPRSVANFIGLAEGSRVWIDPATGATRSGTPYYNGLTFHRVIAGFMNQTGSRNGLGTDGPGYVFRDELNGLQHAEPYVLSMANTGRNTNGSQFFITVAATPWLDGVHTVFGKVVAGTDVVDAINAVATGANDRPLGDVTIHSVAIRRVGAAAAAFDIHAQQLPVCLGLAGSLAVQPGVETRYLMPDGLAAGSIFQVHRSDDLAGWTRVGQIYRAPDGAVLTNVVLDAAAAPSCFYLPTQTYYPDAMGTESNAGKTVSSVWGNQALTLVFDGTGAAGTGGYKNGIVTTPFTFTLYDYGHGVFLGEWIVETSIYGVLRVKADLDSRTGAVVGGRGLLYQWNGVSWGKLADTTVTIAP